jgi:uncharacterized C2H2 Zn-finger protein
MDFFCERCGMDFKSKKYLIQHLKKEVECVCFYSDIKRSEILDRLYFKDGLECDRCNKIYKNAETVRKHKCTANPIQTEKSLRAELEKRIKDLQSEFQEKIQEVINQKSIETTQNIKTIDNSNHHNTNTNIQTQNNNVQNNNVIIINDIKDVLDTAIQYIVKDPNFVDKVLNWVSDKNGMLKYMDEKFYNSDHPENQMIRRLDKEHMELHTLGRWIKYENAKAVELIIRNLGLDWSTLIMILKYDYSDDYDNYKQDIVDFKRNISDPLDMGIDITDDEEDSKEQTKQIELVDGQYILKDVKDDKLVKKEGEWKKKIINHVKTKPAVKKQKKLKQES